MPRTTRGSIYQVKGGLGIRWTHDGARDQNPGPFRMEADARAWFNEHVAPRLRPGALLPQACGSIRAWAQRVKIDDEPGSWVYVIAASDLQRIKIGRTELPMRRLRTHRTASPVPLTTLLMVPGGVKLERKLLEVTAPFVCDSGRREWRTIEALDVVIALIREQAGDRRSSLRLVA